MRHIFCILFVFLGLFIAPVVRAQVDVANTSVYLSQYDQVNQVTALVQYSTPTSGTSWDNVPILATIPTFTLPPGSGNLPSTGEPPMSFVLFDAPGGGPVSAIWYMADGYDFFYALTAANSPDFTTLVNHAIASTSLYATVQATGGQQDVTGQFNSLWSGVIAPLPDGSLEANIAFLATPVPEPTTWVAGALLACPLLWRVLGSFRRAKRLA